MNTNPKVSVIIPVYGVEKYIERCARSLFEQTLEDIEYIFINDCTKDQSVDVLQRVLAEYPNRKSQVKIINNERNLGQAGTRTVGMKNATGQYLIHCDSDDWVDITMYAKLYQKAKEKEADIVVCNHNQVFKNNVVPTSYKQIGIPHEWLRKFRGSWNCWAKLVRRSLIEEHCIYPFEGLNFSEDRCMMMRSFYYANKIELVIEPLYFYDRTREDAITNLYKTNIKIVNQREEVLRKMENWFDSVNFDIGDSMSCWKLDTANMYLNVNPPAWNEWVRLISEIQSYLMDQKYSILLKFSYKCAAKKMTAPYRVLQIMSKIKTKIKSW